VKYSRSAKSSIRSVVKRLQHIHYGKYIIETEYAPKLGAYKAPSTVREFSLKLEAIEAQREDTKLTRNVDMSKTDEQKISLIKTFPVPNTKEDMLEFMILATTNVDMTKYGSIHTLSRSEEALEDAWDSKIRQVHDKAKNSYGDDADFARIENLYQEYITSLTKAKNAYNHTQTMMWVFCGVLAVCMLIFVGFFLIVTGFKF
jgi:hypothetical protein